MAAEPLAFPPSATRKEIKPSSENGELRLSLDNALFFWLILFGFGGGLFALYYSNIGYMPDIKWEESLVYLGALTIAGVFLFVLYFVLLFIPGWMWSEFLIFDNNIRCLRDKKGPLRKEVLIDVGLPFAGFLLAVHFLLDSSRLDKVGITVGVLTALVLSSLGMSNLVLRSAKKCETSASSAMGMSEAGSEFKKQGLADADVAKPPSRRTLALLRGAWASKVVPFENVAFFAISSIASLCSILLIRYSFAWNSGNAMKVVCTVTVTVVNLFVALSCKKRFRRSVMVMAVAAWPSLFSATSLKLITKLSSRR